VRVITNRSSGKMGAALAKAALSAGARVVVVSGPAAEPLPDGAEVVPVRTAAEMEREMVDRFKAADICVMAAAVSDYRPLNYSEAKIHRSDNENIVIELTPNPDILAGLGAAKSEKQFLVGFALESGKGIKYIKRAKEKMKQKMCDMIVFNSADTALGGEHTTIKIICANGSIGYYHAMDKDKAARIIFNEINELARR
jgi:phosphopantothenoylcysteine decarboxylase/phosphopantothenate--cysteine ligase